MKREQRRRLAGALAGLSPTFLIAACAIPATEVAVETMPMRKALEISRADGDVTATVEHNVAPIERRSLPPALQGTILSTPDVRLAYLYEWIDTDGNKHYGEWVAIPVSNSRWVMSDGTQAPIELNPGGPLVPPEGQ